ncbi:MAG TPA: CpsB/CapC family capsule biosynthesis tyrosine phosphatase [Gemmatimonadales bacterium]|nr:CpsB/CapC family capsule biosynthesis tyrosine phosphatase [Gemmatimonadales bacterium]
MIDLHSHLLPAVDDGAGTVEQAVAVLGTMAGHGITGICLTPHLTATEAESGVPAAHDAAFARLTAAAPPTPRLHRGAEVMLDRPLGRAAAANHGVRLGGSRYILVEFPRMVAGATVSHALAHVVSLGLVPVLAHPERYSSCTPVAVQQWRALGGVMQVDATTLLSPRRRGDRARRLVSDGLADILAADNHGDSRMLNTGHAMLCEHGGTEQAELLTVRNPAAILADGLCDNVPPLAFRVSVIERLRRLWHQSGEEP